VQSTHLQYLHSAGKTPAKGELKHFEAIPSGAWSAAVRPELAFRKVEPSLGEDDLCHYVRAEQFCARHGSEPRKSQYCPWIGAAESRGKLRGKSPTWAPMTNGTSFD
jgi:hypothetical protein